jgi:hypothetical protein
LNESKRLNHPRAGRTPNVTATIKRKSSIASPTSKNIAMQNVPRTIQNKLMEEMGRVDKSAQATIIGTATLVANFLECTNISAVLLTEIIFVKYEITF